MLTKPSDNMLLGGSYDGSYDRGLGGIPRRPAFDLLVAQDVVNAREFVNCDGTDEIVGLQKAFDAAKNKRLILPAGEVRYTGPIVLDPVANYMVQGQGYDPNGAVGSRLRNIGISSQIGIVCNDALDAGRDNCRSFQDFMHVGNRYSGDGLQFAAAFGFKLRNMWISTHGGHGVYGYRAFSSAIENVVVTHIGKHGVFFETIGNAVLLKKVIATDASKNGGGFSNICFSANNVADAARGIEISGSCDWTSGGAAKWDGGVDNSATGLSLKYVYGAAIHGNYAESSPNILTYIAATCKSIDFRGNYMQDGDTLIESGAQGVIVEANHFDRQVGTTRLLGSSSQSTNKCRYFGNTYTGGATETLAA